MSELESAVEMNWGPWRPVIVGPRYFGRYGYTVTLRNNWMTLTNDVGGWRRWTHRGAVSKGRRLLARENRDEALRDNPEVVSS